ncbi:MAG TPA: CotH kinase family protein [Bacillota bacterium]|nr:CotH kinase family protein [Bacillota bacterium]
MSKTIKVLIAIVPIILLITFFIQKENEPIIESENNKENKHTIETIHLNVAEEDLNELFERSPFSDDRLNGEATIGDTTAPIEFRFRGNSSRDFPKKSYNIRFEDRQDVLDGKKRLNLNAMWTDPSFMREHIAMQLFHDAGITAPQTSYYELYINDIYEGLYVQVDRVDKDLLKTYDLNPDGTLIRDRFRQAEDLERPSIFGFDLSSVDNKVEFLEENMQYRGEPDWEAFSELVEWVYETPEGESFYDEFPTVFDADNFTTWLAIHIIIGDRDAFGDDYWMYLDHENEQAKWQLIPWDKDLTFGSHYRDEYGVVNDFFAYEYEHLPEESWSNTLITKFIRTPELREDLEKKMIELTNSTVSTETVREKINDILPAIKENLSQKQRKAFSVHEQNSYSDEQFIDEYADVLLDYMTLRTEYLRANIEPSDSLKVNEATIPLSMINKDEPVYFTDKNGWVIASFIATEMTENDGEVTIKVSEADSNNAINRQWTVSTTHPVEGDLSLYYRNDIAHHSKENWFVEDVAIESDTVSQWDLEMVQTDESDEVTALDAVINPFSNKITAPVKLKDSSIFTIE